MTPSRWTTARREGEDGVKVKEFVLEVTEHKPVEKTESPADEFEALLQSS